MPGLKKLLIIIDELEKSYLLKRPHDAEIIKGVTGSFRYAVQKLKEEKEGNKHGR